MGIHTSTAGAYPASVVAGLRGLLTEGAAIVDGEASEVAETTRERHFGDRPFAFGSAELGPCCMHSGRSEVRSALEQHDRPTPASIARRLAIGQRTLQRRLCEEGSSFRKIFEREQRDLALALLRDGSRVIDVAYAVGFGDATSFSKAFRRWTGASPTAYRARAAKREPGRSGPSRGRRGA